MSKNPFIHALLASLYINCLVSLFWWGSQFFTDAQGGVIIPIGMLSIFVFSASVMGYLFLYEPLVLLMAGKKEEAVAFFFKIVAFFALVTVTIIGAWALCIYFLY
ncbi:hypothetical protein H7X87_03425 [Acetobacteraceae bacterium]|nr:hypothetical protein [Candidatus Parcubacteria bacterium]